MTRATLNRRHLPKSKKTCRAATSLTLESLENRCLLSTSATFVKQDTTTQGNWIGTYGQQGYDVIDNTSSLPSYATVTPAGESNNVWAASSTDPRALQYANGSGRIAACWYASSSSSFTVDVDLTDGNTHDLELYFVDWDSTTRAEQIQISNASTGKVLSTEKVTSFHSGDYLEWDVSGNLLITITNTGSPNAVLSGLFLDSTSAPTVTAESPANKATNVAVSSPVTATFSEAVQASTINFTLKNSSGSSVPATVAYSSATDTATLTPNAALAYNTQYTATVSGAQNSNGTPLAAPFTWSFKTDVAPPSVVSETPASGATNVAISTTATATFNEAVQPRTLSFTLTPKGGSPVAATVTYNSSNYTATLTPSAALAYNTTYTATVSGAKDTAGDPMSGPFSWSFTTDPAAPKVTSETPASGATDVAISTTATATFNEAVQAGTISFTLTPKGGSAIAATVTYNSSNYTATLTPSAALAFNTTYTATVSGAKDTAGDPMSGPFSWSFTTDPAAPKVTSETPASGATDVAISTTATATFNEAVQAGTISFTLTPKGGSAIAATLTYNSSNYTATLTPTAALAYNTTYTATVSGAKDTAGDPMSGPFSWSFTTDPAAPKVTSETPASGATDVAISTTATATFNEAVQASTISFTLTPTGGSPIAASVAYNSSNFTATLTPSVALAYNTTYTATVSGAKDSAGDPMAAPFSWSFATDPAAPKVTSETPASGATDVAISTTATATFNEAVQAGTISFALTPKGGSPVAATLTYNSSNYTATLTPTAALAYNTTYTATVSGAKDTAGDPMSGPFSWSFTTDPAAPKVTSETPASGATNVAVSTTATATFSEAVQAGTISFTLTPSGGSPVAATLTYNSSNYTATLTPSAALAYNTTYTATVSGAKDTAGDPMAAPFSWSFTTTTSKVPVVISESPTSGATDVAVSTTATATFNEAVQANTISFTLTPSGGSPIAATLTYNSSNYTATLTPSAALAYNTTYTATVSGAESSTGVFMSGPFSWSFTTDPAAPKVTSETPASGATDVAISTTATATFNEAVQAGTISFTLTPKGGSAIAATVTYNSSNYTATLTPSAALAYNTTYTATVSGAKDTAGDPMSGPFSWSFTTDPAAPKVTSETPASGATDVAISTTATATFNEAVQASTITFTLTPSGGSPVAATVTYNSSNYTAILTPTAALAYNTTYSATVSGAKDTAGDPMSGPFSWSFTTDPAAPKVTSETPASGATNVAISTTATATFNEAVQASTISFTLTPTGGSPVAASVAYNSSNFTATLTPSAALAYNTTYTATVSGAKDSAGDPMAAPFSWSFTTVASTVPNAPTNLADTVSNATQINLTWTENSSGVTGYLVQRATGSNFSTVGTITSGSTTYFSDVGLSPSNTYSYRIIATSASGNSAPSSVISATTAAPLVQSGLVAEWAMDDGQGPSTVDATGDGNTGTLSGSASWTAGLVGPYAVSFSSSNAGHIVVPDSPSLEFTAAQSFSLTAWAYVPSLAGQWAAIAGKSIDSGNWYAVGINPSNQWISGSANGFLTGSNVTTGWSQISLVQNGTAGTQALYVNGVQVANGTAQPGNGTGDFWIGGDPGGDDFNGTIDEVRLYNRALSSTEVQTLASEAPLTVTTESPASGATGVAVSSAVNATFNEAVQSSTISFTLKNSSGGSVAATVSYNSSTDTASLTPSAALAYNTTYTATISGAQSLAGNPLSASVSWSFKTDVAPPSVTSESPASGATNVAVSTTATATFNEAVQASTISFTLTPKGGSPVAATVTYSSTKFTATLSPAAALAADTTYTATVSGAQDSAGDPMAAPFSWSFTTDAPTSTPPTVTNETPASGATNIGVSTTATATFNQAVQASTISFTLTPSGGSPVAATLTYNSSNYTATLTPSSALAYSTTYTANVSGAENSSGTPMSAPFSWSFTTAATAAPYVASESPASALNPTWACQRRCSPLLTKQCRPAPSVLRSPPAGATQWRQASRTIAPLIPLR